MPRLFAPRALLLDMDGLLIDSEPLWYRVESAFAAARGGDWTLEMAHSCIGRGMAATLAAMSARFGFAVDPPADMAFINDDFISRAGELELKPGAAELIHRARAAGLPMAVASGSARVLIDAVLARFDLAPSFASVVSGESVPKPKPAPDIFLRAAVDIGVAPAECAVFEDSIAGATAGHAAGAYVVAVPEGSWEGRGFERVANVIVPSLVHALERLSIG